MSAQPLIQSPFNYQTPDYLPKVEQQMRMLRHIRANPSVLPGLFAHYKEHPEDFVSDWCYTFDPRNAERNLPTTVPFILFPKQRELIKWFRARWLAQEGGVVEKSRDVGATHVVAGYLIAMCLFNNGLTFGIGSRKESLLHQSGDPSSFFEKLRMILKSVPSEFLRGMDVDKCMAHMRLIFPYTSCVIIGEAGDSIGRGARCSQAFVDEAAHIPHPELIDASLSATTNSRIDVSSVAGMNNSFAIKRFSGRVPVFTIRWQDDPRKSDAWYAKQCATLDPLVVAQEIDLNYQSSVEGLLIKTEWINAAINAHVKLGITPSGIKRSGLDIADEGRDQNAFAGRYGILLQHLHSWSGKGSDLFQTAIRAFDLCDTYGYEHIYFDSDGMGASFRGDARVINERRQAAGLKHVWDEPYRGSASPDHPDDEMVPGRKSRDFFSNCKAQSWWNLKMKFQATHRAIVNKLPVTHDEIISIDPNLPELSQLMMELSQITWTLNTVGKLQINKTPPGMKSPNLADAVCIAFNPASHVLETWMRL